MSGKRKAEREEDYVGRKRRTSPKTNFLDGNLITKLDAVGLSDYQSVRVIAEVAQALGHSLGDLVLSRRTIQRARAENRRKIAEQIKDTFSVP